tara:strand:- start:4363 stop:4827 length:465 start_codon:yes stop_codon:yes gene_type:complete
MAFILTQHKSEFGITHESAYANIHSYNVDLTNKICKVYVHIYASMESRMEESTPVEVKTYIIKGDDFTKSLETTNFLIRDSLELPPTPIGLKEGVTNVATSNMYIKLQKHKDFTEALPVFEIMKGDKRKELSLGEAQSLELELDEDFEVVDSLG